MEFNKKRYFQYSKHLENFFGCKVYKITLDAGFDCPNRDGTKSSGGCIFCDESGSFSRAHSNILSIEKQLKESSNHLRDRFKAQKFLAYFQAYTNTYASVERLRQVYDNVFTNKDVVGMSIGTRPDCVDEEKLNLIEEYAKKYYVWIEYGLQSSHNKTLKLINRGHTVEDFTKAIEMTKGRNIKICAHIILGLPDETREDMLETARFIAKSGVDGIKIHLLCALKGTKLADMYENGVFIPMGEEEYVQTVCDFLELLPSNMTIHRIAGNGLKEILIAPKWLDNKFSTLNKIDKELERRDSWQGKLLFIDF